MSLTILFVCKSLTDLFFGPGVIIFLSDGSLVYPPVLKQYRCRSRSLQKNKSVMSAVIAQWLYDSYNCGAFPLPDQG